MRHAVYNGTDKGMQIITSRCERRENEVSGARARTQCYAEIVICTLSKIPRASNSFYPTTNGRLPTDERNSNERNREKENGCEMYGKRERKTRVDPVRTPIQRAISFRASPLSFLYPLSRKEHNKGKNDAVSLCRATPPCPSLSNLAACRVASK